MSWQATARIAEIVDGISRSEKLLLLVLANRHNIDTGRCDASVGRIAIEALMSTRTVHRSLDRLEQKGMITIERRGGRTNQYRLICAGDLGRGTPDISRGGSRRRTPAILSPLPLTPDVTPTPDIFDTTPDISRGTNRKIEPKDEPKLRPLQQLARARETDQAYGAACTAVETLTGSLNKTTGDAIAAMLDRGTPAAWVEAACEEAALANVRRLSYVVAIVDRWRAEGFKSERRPNGRARDDDGRRAAAAPNGRAVGALPGADHARPRTARRSAYEAW